MTHFQLAFSHLFFTSCCADCFFSYRVKYSAALYGSAADQRTRFRFQFQSVFILCRVWPVQLLQVHHPFQLLPPEASAPGRQQHHTQQHACWIPHLPPPSFRHHVWVRSSLKGTSRPDPTFRASVNFLNLNFAAVLLLPNSTYLVSNRVQQRAQTGDFLYELRVYVT